MDPGSDSLSRTSQAVALTRAAMNRPHTEQGDPDGQTEPWLTIRPATAWLQLLAECGWVVHTQADPRSGSGAEGRSLLVVALAQELLRAARTPCESGPPSASASDAVGSRLSQGPARWPATRCESVMYRNVLTSH